MNSSQIFKKACELYSLGEIVKLTKISKATLSLLKNEKYPNPQKKLDQLAEHFSFLNSENVKCPTLGEIHTNVCARYRAWAKSEKVHHDRLYRMVKGECNECNVCK
ncbi:MAG: hypothetical protein GQ570_02720 [Helicobacteraceae bacterium]|nr:hypothetical protein [Helicobacteraceae bacterium]